MFSFTDRKQIFGLLQGPILTAVEICLHSPDRGLLSQQTKFSCIVSSAVEVSVSFSCFLLPSQSTHFPSVAEGAPALTCVLLKFDNLNPRLIYAFCMKKTLNIH